MRQRPFVVTGTALSGLGHTARVLTALGAPCGHEDVFHPAAFERGGTLFWPPSFAGDASWFAAPVLAKLPPASVILHQVRHPLAVIDDLVRSGFFERDTPERAFAHDFIPETRRGGPVSRSLALWLHWNRMIETAEEYDDLVYRRHRVEELDAHRVCETVALLGLIRNPSTAQKVLTAIGSPAVGAPPTEPTSAGEVGARAPLGWSELPPGKARSDVRAAARRYGYEVDLSDGAAPPLHEVRQ